MIGYYYKLIMIEFVPKVNKSKKGNLTLLEIAFCMKKESVVCKSAKYLFFQIFLKNFSFLFATLWLIRFVHLNSDKIYTLFCILCRLKFFSEKKNKITYEFKVSKITNSRSISKHYQELA